MNDKAKEIGMSSTNFANSSGINNPDNYSTVRDIAKMSKYLIKNYPNYYEYFKVTEFTWERTGGNPITQGNRNPLLYKNIGVDGIKTGHLVVEEYSLASSIKKDTRRLIAVGSGFKTKNLSYT
jgi:D-alanyl-D-alanine carboxypeptidase (penicillin-binding protein 5/6)